MLPVLEKWNFWAKPNNKAGIRRQITANISKFIKNKQVISLTGIRRSGKSTIMYQIMDELVKGGEDPKNILYVNFEDPFFAKTGDLKMLDAVYQTYRENINPDRHPYLFLDEIQNIEQWERWVRTKNELGEAKIFITGSSAKLLSSEVASALTGRNINFKIWPLSFREFLIFNGLEVGEDSLAILSKKTKIRSLLKKYLKWGGFPETTMEKDDEKKEIILKQYFEDILFRDIVQRHEIRDVHRLKALAVTYLTNISSLSSYNNLKKTLGAPLDVIANYTSYLSESFLISEMPRFSFKLKEQQVSPKKVYCTDGGMRNCIAFRFMEDIAKLAENSVYNFLSMSGNEIYYHKGRQETDFVIKEGMKISEVIQVSYTSNTLPPREISAIEEASQFYGLKKAVIVTDDIEKEIKTDRFGLNLVPLWKYLLK
ncbi:MAG: ATP-binding protein [Deltaproteobacteria bacterium]|nr:ATP-binding protein [Deltaproteobacteria bacterium]